MSGRTLEAPGGLVGVGTPEEAARNEALEEVGLRLRTVDLVCAAYMAPQLSGELTHLFVSEYDYMDVAGPGGGIADEGECIEVVEMPFSQALEAVSTGAISDAKTILLVIHLARVIGVEQL
jgi:nudix-type nucleoside diphosphatase (YffH/AdpP family)